MAKQDIKRLLDQASNAMKTENSTQADTSKYDLKKLKTKTVDNISKTEL